MTIAYRYPFYNLGGDYFRSIFGLIICLLPLLIAYNEGDGISGGLFIFPGLAALFGFFFANTGLKQKAVVAIDDHCISISGLMTKTIRWDDLCGLKLSYYTTWRGGENGWMQLRLESADATLRLSSNLTGFNDFCLQLWIFPEVLTAIVIPSSVTKS